MHNKTPIHLFLINEKKLSSLTERSLSSIRKDRLKGKGIPYIKFGRKVMYDMRVVADFLNKNTITFTSQIRQNDAATFAHNEAR